MHAHTCAFNNEASVGLYPAKKLLQQVVLDFDKTNSLGLILENISFVVPLVPSGQGGSMTEP